MVTSCAWDGALRSGTSWFQVFACIFCPPLIFVRSFIKFNYSKDITLGDPESIVLVAITARLKGMKTIDMKASKKLIFCGFIYFPGVGFEL